MAYPLHYWACYVVGILLPQEKQNTAPSGFLLPHFRQKTPPRPERSFLRSPNPLSISSRAVLNAVSISFPAVLRASVMSSPRSDPFCVAVPHFGQKLAVSGSFVPHLTQNGIKSPSTLLLWGSSENENHCAHDDGHANEDDQGGNERKP
jgi:hypothetical protein